MNQSINVNQRGIQNRGLEPEYQITRSLETIRRGISDSGIPTGVFKVIMGPLTKYFLEYIGLIGREIFYTKNLHYNQGFCEGYARAITWYSMGLEVGLLPFFSEWDKTTYTSKQDLQEILKGKEKIHPVYDYGLGFFDGKGQVLKNMSDSGNPSPEKILNDVYKCIASCRGIKKKDIIPKLRHWGYKEIEKTLSLRAKKRGSI